MLPFVAFQVSTGVDERTRLPDSGRSEISAASDTVLRSGEREKLPLWS